MLAETQDNINEEVKKVVKNVEGVDRALQQVYFERAVKCASK
jgi:hypothetical protein